MELSPTQVPHYSHNGVMRKSKGQKERKIVNSDKDNLKGKESHACKQSKTRNSFTASLCQAGVYPFPGKEGSGKCKGYLERQWHNTNFLVHAQSPHWQGRVRNKKNLGSV